MSFAAGPAASQAALLIAECEPASPMALEASVVDRGAGERSGEPPGGEAVQTPEIWSKAFCSRERLPAGKARAAG